MNTLDLIIAVLIAVPAFFGFRKGFLRSVFSLAGFIAGLILATKYSAELSARLSFVRIDERATLIASFIMILIFVYVVSNFIASKLAGINSFTKGTDKIAGAAFGAFKGVIFTSLLLLASTKAFSVVSEQTLTSSVLYPFVIDAAPKVYNAVMNFVPGAKTFYEEMSKTASNLTK